MLTNESLQQICGANTIFSHVNCEYGLFPPAGIRALSPEIKNWGEDDNDDNKSTIRKFFNRNKIIVCRAMHLRYYTISEETTPISFWQYNKVFVSLIFIIWKYAKWMMNNGFDWHGDK